MNKKIVKLYSNCIPVKGYRQAFLVDLQRNWNSNVIPNSLYMILKGYENKTIEEIKRAYNNKYDDTIEEYFDFLLRNEFAFVCSEKEMEQFPSLDLTWKSPSLIENAIIDIDDYFFIDIEKCIAELSELRCNALQLRFYDKVSVEILENIAKTIENTRILFVESILTNGTDIKSNDLIDLVYTYPRFQRIHVYNREQDKVSECYKIIEYKKYVSPSINCGYISDIFFSINISMFTESQSFNTCLNRKVSIDKKGNIKNCPSMSHSFGNIRDTTIAEAMKHPDFKKYWNLSKDKIEVCKDCEYRHMCTDCRAYLKQADNIYSQPAKCSYNPYIAKWKTEDGYIPVEECGFYNETGKFVLNKEKVDSLNLQLWGE